MPFSCSICEQESTRICAFCTKDACNIHICDRCGNCSDCCECDVPLDEPRHVAMYAPVVRPDSRPDFATPEESEPEPELAAIPYPESSREAPPMPDVEPTVSEEPPDPTEF